MKTPHYDISKDSDFKEANDDELIELYGPIIELGFAEDRRFSVQFVNVDRGYGLFAEVPIQKGRVVGEYTGVLTEDDSDSDYQWTYKGEVRRNSSTKPLELSTDARYAGNLMRFVNDGPNPNIDSVFVPWKGIWRVLYVAKRFIAEGEECIVSYGSEYWSSRTNEH